MSCKGSQALQDAALARTTGAHLTYRREYRCGVYKITAYIHIRANYVHTSRITRAGTVNVTGKGLHSTYICYVRPYMKAKFAQVTVVTAATT